MEASSFTKSIESYEHRNILSHTYEGTILLDEFSSEKVGVQLLDVSANKTPSIHNFKHFHYHDN